MKKLLILLFLILVSDVCAAENNGYFLSPPFEEIEIAASDSQKTFILELGNNTKNTATFDLSVVDFGSLDESGGVAFLTDKAESNTRKYALASWVSLEKDVVVIDPGKKEKIKITIINKDSLSAGGHYGAVLAGLRHEDDSSGALVGVNQTMASLIYVQKSGGEKRSLELVNIDVERSWWKIPDQIFLRFENRGNTHLVPRGKAEVYRNQDYIVSKGIINEGSAKIIPESFRKFEVEMGQYDQWLWPGIYQLKVSYRFDGVESFFEKKMDLVYYGKEGLILTLIGVTLLSVILWKLIWKNR